MAEPLFDIVFRGDVVLGHSIVDVKARLAQLFKVDAAKIETLFSGGAMPLKRNLDRAAAEKYKTVLTKAGAQVQIRPAANTKPAATPSRPSEPSESRTQTVLVNRQQRSPPSDNVTFTLAPAGSNLLSPSETRRSPVVDLDLSAISLKPMEGDLLEESEKPKPVNVNIPVGQFEIAAAGADLLEGYKRDELPLPEIDPDFEIAEVGVDLLDVAHRPRQEFLDINVAHLQVLPLETSGDGA